MKGCYIMGLRGSLVNNSRDDDMRNLLKNCTQLCCSTCRVAKFNGVTSLLAYFPTNYGAETTKIYYIGLRGDFTQVKYNNIIIITVHTDMHNILSLYM